MAKVLLLAIWLNCISVTAVGAVAHHDDTSKTVLTDDAALDEIVVETFQMPLQQRLRRCKSDGHLSSFLTMRASRSLSIGEGAIAKFLQHLPDLTARSSLEKEFLTPEHREVRKFLNQGIGLSKSLQKSQLEATKQIDAAFPKCNALCPHCLAGLFRKRIRSEVLTNQPTRVYQPFKFFERALPGFAEAITKESEDGNGLPYVLLDNGTDVDTKKRVWQEFLSSDDFRSDLENAIGQMVKEIKRQYLAEHQVEVDADKVPMPKPYEMELPMMLDKGEDIIGWQNDDGIFGMRRMLVPFFGPNALAARQQSRGFPSCYQDYDLHCNWLFYFALFGGVRVDETDRSAIRRLNDEDLQPDLDESWVDIAARCYSKKKHFNVYADFQIKGEAQRILTREV